MEMQNRFYWNIREIFKVDESHGSLSNVIVAKLLEMKICNFYTKELEYILSMK